MKTILTVMALLALTCGTAQAMDRPYIMLTMNGMDGDTVLRDRGMLVALADVYAGDGCKPRTLALPSDRDADGFGFSLEGLYPISEKASLVGSLGTWDADVGLGRIGEHNIDATTWSVGIKVYLGR